MDDFSFTRIAGGRLGDTVIIIIYLFNIKDILNQLLAAIYFPYKQFFKFLLFDNENNILEKMSKITFVNGKTKYHHAY